VRPTFDDSTDWLSRLAGPLRMGDRGAINAILPQMFPHAERLLPFGIAHHREIGGLPRGLRLKNASWVPGWDFLLDRDGYVLSDTGYISLGSMMGVRPHLVLPESSVLLYLPETTVTISAPTIRLSAPVPSHFGHWLVDFLPRLSQTPADFDGAQIAVPAGLNAKQIATLACLGIAPERLLVCADTARYTFNDLWAYVPGSYIPPVATHVRFVRNGLYDPAAPRGARRLFILRGGLGSRLVANMEELSAWLDANGFEYIDPSQMSFEEERAAISSASVLVGTFGSHLLSLYFAHPGTRVICLKDKGGVAPVLAETCELFRLSYAALECERTDGFAALKKDYDVKVDIAALARLI
jgi:hypothetical protein